MKYILLVINLLIFYNFAISGSKLEFERLNSNNGLSSEEIRNIFQDSEGYLWFLTREGLNQYDGYDIIVYGTGNEDMSFPSPAFESITEDLEHNLWLGTYGDGISIFDKSTFSVLSFTEFSNGLFIPDKNIRTLLTDIRGNIWIGTEYGLYRYNKSAKDLKFYNLGNPGDIEPAWCIVETMIEDSEGNIWVGTWNMGLYIFNPVNEKWSNFNLFDKREATPHNNRIKSLFEDRQGYIWIGTWEDGLYQVSYSEAQFNMERYFLYDDNSEQSIAGDIIYSINQDLNGNLWVGTPYGLSVIENLYTEKPYFNNFTSDYGSQKGLSNNEVWSIYKDRSGLMWLGTLEGGVNKVHPEGIVFESYTIPHVSTQIYSQTIQSFCIDPAGKLLVGVKSLGFGIYDLENRDYIHYTGSDTYKYLVPGINTVNCFHPESDDFLWMGTRYGGLIVYDYKSHGYSIVNEFNPAFSYENVNVILQTGDSIIWAGTDNGLYRIVRCDDDISCFDIRVIDFFSRFRVVSLFEDQDEWLWAGTAENGIIKLDGKDSTGRIIAHFTRESENIPTNRIQCIYQDSRGQVWAGSSDFGLLQLESSGPEFREVSIAKGLNSGKIFDITEDFTGDLWLTTNNGLSRLSTSRDAIAADSYTVTDGLLGNIFVKGALLIQNNNRIFAGGYYGFNTFFPSDVKPNPYLPPTAITGIYVDDNQMNNDFRDTEPIRLSHKENNISFRFSAMSFYKQDKNSYSYLLEGVHDDWQFVDASVRTARFPDLSAGSYTFRLKSANSSELWNQHPVEIEFVILPAPYKTWWAYTGYSLAILVTLVIIYRFLLRSERIKRALEIEKIEHAKSEKLNQFKLRFFTNISHEIMTPLSIISCSMDLIKSKTRKGRKEFTIVERNIHQLNRLLSQLLDFRKMEGGHLKLQVERGDMNAFLNEIVDNFIPLADMNRLSLTCRTDTDCDCWFDKDKFYKILDNLISNSIKYTPAGGSVMVKASIIRSDTNTSAEIKVIDTGKGIKPEDTERIFDRFYRSDAEKEDTGTGIGLAFTRNLVELHKGRISLSSEVEKGTSFTIRIPVKKEAYSPDELYYPESGPEQVSQIAFKEPDRKHKEEYMSTSGKDISLLLVDDNHDFREILTRHFSTLYDVSQASNGREALDKAREFKPDIIVSDVMMAGMDGFELCTELKSNVDTRDIPVILLTAKADEEARREGYGSGADSYITKPVSLPVLEARINSLLAKRAEFFYPDNETPVLKSFNPKIPDHIFIRRVDNYINDEISNPDLSVSDISSYMGMSDSMFYRKIKQMTRKAPVEYIKNNRLNRAARMLRKGNVTISDVAFSSGFSDQSYFTACFKKQFGKTPSEYTRSKTLKEMRSDM